MNLFKILIPKDGGQEVTELESWKVSWKVVTDFNFGYTTVKYKCFIKEDEAKEFKKQLEECAKFIGTPIETEISRN